MDRIVEPELLDSLPADDRRAKRSRLDLIRINRIMHQDLVMARALATLPPPPTVVDLGSGDGRFLLSVVRHQKKRRRVNLFMADRQKILEPATRRALKEAGWHATVLEGDIFETLQSIEPGATILANLFLHHFAPADLKRLLALIAAKADAFVACEPRRSAFALFAARQVGWIGANDVTRHDAAVSVRAGFAGEELTALWPKDGWRCVEHKAYLFTHCFVAKRNAL